MLSFEIFTALEAIRNKRRGQNIQEIYNNLIETLSSDEDKRLLQRFFKQEPFSEEEKATLQGELMQKVSNVNPELYNPAVYLALLPYVKLMYSAEKNGIPEEHAYKLAVVFEDEKKALAYIEAYLKSHPEPKQLMHDACNFALPQDKFDLKTWQKLCAKFLLEDPFRNLILPQAPALEKLIKSSQKKVKPSAEAVKKATAEVEKINSVFRKLEKRHGELGENTKSKDLLKLIEEMKKILVELGVSDVDKKDSEEQYQELLKILFQKQIALADLGVPFNDQLSYTMLLAFRRKYISDAVPAYRYFLEHGLTDNDYGKFKALSRQDNDEKIPNIRIDGASLGHPGYYLMKVPVLDELHAARAACLGKLTGCCQSLSGEAGESCVIHGLTSPYAGFYVVCKGDMNNPQVTDELIGQCWAWRSKSNAIVFDSIEVRAAEADQASIEVDSVEKQEEMIKTVAKGMFQHLAQEIVMKNHAHKVSCGAYSGISSEVGMISALNSVEEFADYEGYCDSVEQRVLYDKNKPFYWYGKEAQSTQETEKLIEEALRSSEPLTKSSFLITALNWAVYGGRKDLIARIEEMAKEKYPERLPEIVKITKVIRAYLIQDETENEFSVALLEDALLEIVNYQGTPLQDAAWEGTLEDVKALLEKGANIHAKNSKGKTALMLAAERGHTDIVQLLLEKGASLNVVDSHGKTALMHALENPKNKATVRLLLDKGADVNTVDRAGLTPLMLAFKNYGSTPLLALEMIEKGASANPTEIFQNPPLFWALEYGHREAALKLIEKGANIHFKDLRDKKTLLQHAINKEDVALALIQRGADVTTINGLGQSLLFDTNSPAVAKALLEKGVDIDLQDTRGRTALTNAMLNQKYDLALFLVEQGANVKLIPKDLYSALRAAVRPDNPNIKLIQALIAKGADVNEIREGTTILMDASHNVEVVQELLKSGADASIKTKNGTVLANLRSWESGLLVLETFIKAGVDINGQNEQGETPLIQVAKSARAAVYDPEANKARENFFQALLDKGADINIKDKAGCPPLRYTLQNNYSEESLLLISKGATLDFISETGNPPLHIAMDKFQENVALKLIEVGADVNGRNRKNQTPLMFAAVWNYQKVLQALLDKKAEINATDNNGDTALMMVANGYTTKESVLKTLIEQGAEINLKNKAGKSALMIAISRERDDLFQLLVENKADVQASDNEGNTILHMIADRISKKIPEGLFETKIKVNVKNKAGDTALMIAVRKNHAAFLKAIVESGADINVKNNEGETALMMAVKQERFELAEELIKNRADVNATNNNGDSMLKVALDQLDQRIIPLLLSKGAILNLPKEEQYKPLVELILSANPAISSLKQEPKTITRAAPLTFMTRVQQPPTVTNLPVEGDINEKLKEAVKKDDPQTLLALMERAGWEIDKFILDDDANSCSLLMHACEEGAVNVVQTLLRQGAQVNLEDEDGDTALTYAADCEEESQKYIIKLLVDNNASLSHQNKAGETAFDRVQESEQSEDESENELSDMDVVSELGDSDNEEDSDVEEVTELLALLDPAQEKEKPTESKRRAPVIFTQPDEKQAEKEVPLTEVQHQAKKIKPQ